MENHIFELVDLGGDQGYILNLGIQDTISGLTVQGFWTKDENIKKIFKSLTQK
jgi:hypothetical protein